MEKCNILLLDEQPLLMEGVRSLLSPHPDIRILGMAQHIDIVREIIKKCRPDIVIMDMTLSAMTGVEAVQCMRDLCPSAKILVYTMHRDRRFLLELIQLGIYAHVTKAESADILLEAIQKVRQGRVFLSGSDPGSFLIKLMQQKVQCSVDIDINILSSREKEVFLRLADGQSIRHVAADLHISPKTVESHKYNIFNKLRIGSAGELIKIAIRLGLVHI